MSNKGNEIREALWNKDAMKDDYAKNEKYQEHLLEQYKLYVEMADNISARRNMANTFFLTLHTIIVGAIGFVFEKGPALSHKFFILLPLFAILALCYAWWRIVKAYRQLNGGKFEVIGALEKRLPTSPYHAEWKALGEGRDPKLYTPLSHIENWIPVIFGIIYILGALFLLFS